MRQAKDAAPGDKETPRGYAIHRDTLDGRTRRECASGVRAPEAGMRVEPVGTVDVHVHCGPEGIVRRYDPVQIAQHAAEVGLRTMVLKSHFTGTGGWAEIAHRLTGVRLCGSVTLNHHVGGINPFAVRAALGPADETGSYLKVVWLPTVHAAAHLATMRARGERHDVPPEWSGGVLSRVAERLEAVTPISVLADSVQQPLDDVLRLIAAHRLVLATGHVGRDEVFHVVRRARSLGVDRIMVTHAQGSPPGLEPGDHEALAAAGAFMELTYVTLDMGRVSARDTAALIRRVGAQHVVLSSDLGQVDRVPPGEGLVRFRELLLAEGLTAREVDMTLRDNPSALLGLGPA